MNEIHRHNSNMVNYSSSLRTKEENFDNVGFESSKACRGKSRAKLTRFEHVKTKDDSSGVLRETVASTMRVTLASSKSSSGGSGGSGGSSNSMSIHPRTMYSHKKEIPKDDRIWTTIPGCQKCKRDSLEIRISKCVTNIVRFDTMIKMNEKQMERCIGMICFRY